MSTHGDALGCQPVEINGVLERLARLTGAQSDAALAEALGTSRQVLSGWRKRGTIPYEKLIEFAQSFEDVSLNYLLWGEDPVSVEVPVKGNRISAQKLEVIGDALQDAVDKVKAENGPDYEAFMRGPQIFAYAAIVYNRTIDEFPPGHIWTPAVDREIANIIEVVKLDFERQLARPLFRSADDPDAEGSAEASQKGTPQEPSRNTKGANTQAPNEGASQSISGEGHQIAGGNIENKGSVSIGRRYKK